MSRTSIKREENIERSILGACLIEDRGTLETVLSQVQPCHFSLESHARIYKAVQSLAQSGDVNHLLLTNELAKRNEIGSVGGWEYVTDLTKGIPKAGGSWLTRVIDELIESWRVRQIKKLAQALENGGSSDAMMEAIAGEMERLKQQGFQTARKPESLAGVRARVVCLADVEAKPVRWLWEPYIPLGMVSIISGDPGAGKSFVALSIAADLTNGRMRGAPRYNPGGVLYLTLENPLAEVMRPRLDSLGGDPKLFWVVNGTVYENENGNDESGIITLADLDLLDETIQAQKVRLVVIDPLTSFIGQGKNLNHANETRPVFDRLATLAERHECAVVVVRHNNKQSGGKAIYRGAGSVDMTGAVRSEMLAAINPENPEQRALAHIKTNIGPQGRTQGYVIEPDGQGSVRFSWTGELAITAEELNVSPEAPENRTKQDEAREWLIELLREGSREQREIEKLAGTAGLKWRTVQRAKADSTEIRSRKTSMAGHWIWYLDGVDFQKNLAPPKSSENGRLLV